MGVEVRGAGSTLTVRTLSWCTLLEVFERPLVFILLGFSPPIPPNMRDLMRES